MMKLTTAVTLALLATATPARAEWDLKALSVMIGGQTADMVSTYHIINKPSLHCHEANALLGAHPSAAKLILPKETRDHEELRKELRELHAEIRELRRQLPDKPQDPHA